MNETNKTNWNEVSARLGNWARESSGTWSIAVRCEPGAGRGAPACFVPGDGEIEVDAEYIRDELEGLGDFDLEFRPEDPDTWHRYPRTVGVVGHELSHERHSDGFPPPTTPELIHATWVALEESRCEHLYTSGHYRSLKPYIRIAISDIVAPSLLTDPDKMGVFAYSQIAALLMARVDTGVLDAGTFAPLEEKLRDELGDVYDTLRELWQEFLRTADGDIPVQVEIARRYVDALKPLFEKEREEIQQRIQEMMDSAAGDAKACPHPGAGEPEGEGSFGEAGQTIRDAMLDSEMDAEEAIGEEAGEREAAERERARSRAKSGVKTHGKAFSRGEEGQPEPEAGTAEVQVKHVDPTDAALAAANRLAKALEKASYRDRTVTKVAATLPPGRLDGRARMQKGIAQRRGVPSDARPWHAKKRRHVESPTMRIGIMLDRSGSMNYVSEPATQMAWAFAHAAFKIQATTAAVAYGRGATPLVYPHARPKQVPVVPVNAPGEAFEDGFHALNSALDLFPGTGPRLLVIITDGRYVWDRHAAFAKMIIPQLVRDGVHVLRLSPGSHFDGYYLPKQVEQVRISGSLDEMVAVAGKAAVKLLEEK